MIRISLSDNIHHNQSHAFFVHEKAEIKPILQKVFGTIPEIMLAFLEREEFSGQAGKLVSLPYTHEGKLLNIFFLGIGKENAQHKHPVENARRALGSLVKALQRRKFGACCVHFPAASLFSVSEEYFAQEMTLIANMAAYHFDDYITDEARKYLQDFSLHFIFTGDSKKEWQAGITRGNIIAQAVNKVRHWIDLPPSTLTPPELSAKAKAIAQEYGLACTIFDEIQINKMGMGGLSAVAAGSEIDCNLAILEYKSPKPNAPTIAFVGKGITFDSGGLSIKPAQSMETMKEDMSGAAAVIGTMQVIAQLKPDVNIVGITPLSENLPSGTATKPGDIITFYNGKTAEVRNTDAEGRLILADALSYAVKHYKPDAIIDLATLTGACAHALGPFYSGMMGKDENLLKKVEQAAQQAGERVWQLPFDDDYQKAIVSPVADICNIGKPQYKAGAITAGFFLYNFVENTPWVHLDIAGTAFEVPDIPYYDAGATGVGVRMLVQLAMNWK